MTSDEGTCGNDDRVLMLLRESRDAASIPRVLAGIGVDSLMCATPAALCDEIGQGAGAVLIEEEALSPGAGALLRGTLQGQPSWSELPVIILLRRGSETRAAREALLLPADVTLVERPVRVNTLVAVIRSALRSRRRQYLLRDDLDERRRVEEEIKRLNTELATRADELQAANRELEAFNYAVAHDLRTPLTVISGYIGLVDELCRDELRGECPQFLQAALDGTMKMNQLIGALLEFSGLARIEPRREMVDLVSMAGEIVEELRLAEPERRVTLRIHGGGQAVGDPGLLRVALANLLGNAWKYTRMREEAVIEFGVTTKVEGDMTWFVRDNGAGFAMADAANLFLPFQRLPGAPDFGGHGIGLATVERVIGRHGGRIWAQGEPGVGATFYFTLPSTKAGREPSPRP